MAERFFCFICTLLCLALNCSPLFSKGNRDSLELKVEDILDFLLEEDRETDAQALLEYYYDLAQNQIDINSISEQGLKNLLVLTDYQITNLIKYRKEHGAIWSVTQLSLIDGYNIELANFLSNFLSFKTQRTLYKPKLNSVLIVRASRILEHQEFYDHIPSNENDKSIENRYLGSSYYAKLKFKTNYLDKYALGFTLEKDAGEKFLSKEKIPMGDFFSFFVSASNIALNKNRGLIIDKIILGDYSARFGQGLTLWNSFSIGGLLSPQSFCKQGSTILPYTSSDENNYNRGLALCLSFPKIKTELTMLLSYTKIDARIKDGKYTSIISGGYHNTIGTMATRKTLGQSLGGINIIKEFRKFKIGTSFIMYKYDKENGRLIKDYNKYREHSGAWANGSVDLYAILGKFRLFGELAIDLNGNFAALAGAILEINYKTMLAVHLRDYSERYVASFSNAYTSSQYCYNQRGIVLSLQRGFAKGFNLLTSGEIVYYPYPRYNINESSMSLKLYLKLDYKSSIVNSYLKLSNNYSSYNKANRLSLKGVLKYNLCQSFSSDIKAEIAYGQNNYSYSSSIGFDYIFLNESCKIQARLCYYDAKDWFTRLYIYESDMPGSFSSRLLYGKGFTGYLNLRVKPFRWLSAYFKISAPILKAKVGADIKF